MEMRFNILSTNFRIIIYLYIVLATTKCRNDNTIRKIKQINKQNRRVLKSKTKNHSHRHFRMWIFIATLYDYQYAYICVFAFILNIYLNIYLTFYLMSCLEFCLLTKPLFPFVVFVEVFFWQWTIVDIFADNK